MLPSSSKVKVTTTEPVLGSLSVLGFSTAASGTEAGTDEEATASFSATVLTVVVTLFAAVTIVFTGAETAAVTETDTV